ncbi:MAG: CPBP family intramembrane metalloprotease [Butyrivibrio sp.]|nr:CPBP family intramembrane metalloprotease [Butyrivibrio sp.]
MNYKKANRGYLYMILSTIVFVILLSLWMIRTGGQPSITVNNGLSELVMFLPPFAMVLYYGEKLSVIIPLRRVKLSSFFMTLLYSVCLFPIATLANAISMLFVDNTVVELSDQILSLPMWQMLISIGLIGPFMEEIVFRGIFLQSYQRTGRIIGSIILSSVLFGLMHMNFNQFAYGTVIGIMFALLVESTGSVLASFVAHAFFNSAEVITMYLSSDLLEEAEQYLPEMSELTQQLISIGIYFVLAVIAVAIGLCILYKISEIEGRKDFFINIPKSKKQGYKLITASLIIAVAIALAYMIGIEFLSSLV